MIYGNFPVQGGIHLSSKDGNAKSAKPPLKSQRLRRDCWYIPAYIVNMWGGIYTDAMINAVDKRESSAYTASLNTAWTPFYEDTARLWITKGKTPRLHFLFFDNTF